MSRDTIFALSSGAPPAGIAILRVSGPAARETALALAGPLPPPRMATLRRLADRGDPIDQGLLIWFPAGASATGEDVAEFHVHGGRAVVARLLDALAARDGLRLADPGEFSRRAALNGRLSLAEAEALGDLLRADTEAERRAAIAGIDGTLGTMFTGWRDRVLTLSAMVEAQIDYDGEADVADTGTPGLVAADLERLCRDVDATLEGPAREELREGIRVVLSGPPNSGKSSLLNRLAGRDAALVTPIAGTTRDVLEVELSVAGRKLRLIDTAGLRDTSDPVEALGISRARAAAATGDIRVWLGDDEPPADAVPTLAIMARCDLAERVDQGRLRVSAVTGEGVAQLLDAIVRMAPALRPDSVTLNRRQRDGARRLLATLDAAVGTGDLLIVAEELRRARGVIDEMIGGGDVDAMLDRLFAGFCLGK